MIEHEDLEEQLRLAQKVVSEHAHEHAQGVGVARMRVLQRQLNDLNRHVDRIVQLTKAINELPLTKVKICPTCHQRTT